MITCYATVCWPSGVTNGVGRKLDKLVRRSSSVLGCPPDSIQEVVRSIMEPPPPPPACTTLRRACRALLLRFFTAVSVHS